jgi:hypothetical protein
VGASAASCSFCGVRAAQKWWDEAHGQAAQPHEGEGKWGISADKGRLFLIAAPRWWWCDSLMRLRSNIPFANAGGFIMAAYVLRLAFAYVSGTLSCLIISGIFLVLNTAFLGGNKMILGDIEMMAIVFVIFILGGYLDSPVWGHGISFLAIFISLFLCWVIAYFVSNYTSKGDRLTLWGVAGGMSSLSVLGIYQCLDVLFYNGWGGDQYPWKPGWFILVMGLESFCSGFLGGSIYWLVAGRKAIAGE